MNSFLSNILKMAHATFFFWEKEAPHLSSILVILLNLG